jgi:transcription factor IIIB 90 kDa subunit
LQNGTKANVLFYYESSLGIVGRRRIHEIANQPQIRMNERLAEAAQRFFNLAVINNFTKGRKANNVVAACLYIVCRLEKTAHMLIDFADALSVRFPLYDM